jgi:hypothetical protein
MEMVGAAQFLPALLAPAIGPRQRLLFHFGAF